MLLDWRFDGFPGRVLWIDLTQGTVESKEIPHDWLIESMGGKGLATRLLVEWDTTDYAEAMKLKSVYELRSGKKKATTSFSDLGL